jgi:hypothetical protein
MSSITFSDSMSTVDPNFLYTPPSLDEISEDSLPDPEGYYVGQEEYGYDPDDDYVKDNDYDDMYEPDFQYDAY